MLDRSALAERLAERDTRALAERAVEDREWTYGHVVVDEAQDLSAMDWRVLLRRCPTRSLTVVGDLAQRESRAGARSWAEVLDPYVPGRWAYRELTVNYRTPAEIMAVAARVLALVDPALQAPSSVRDAGERPHVRRVHPDRLAAAVRSAVEELRPKQGTLAVIAPEGLDVGAGADAAHGEGPRVRRRGCRGAGPDPRRRPRRRRPLRRPHPRHPTPGDRDGEPAPGRPRRRARPHGVTSHTDHSGP